MNNIPEWANWVARDKSGRLQVFQLKPGKSVTMKYWITDGWGDLSIKHFNETDDTFLNVRWEDEEPTPIKKPADPVNHPSHYNIGGIESIDIIKSMLTVEEYKGYLKGNILKYRERAEHKGNSEQDYAKAKVYYDWLQEL